MKKHAVLMLTMFMVLSFGTAASAAMSIEIDFYGGSRGYAQGVYDTGGEITLNFVDKDWVMVDIIASGVEIGAGVTSTSWVLDFDPSNMQISDLDPGPGWFGTFVQEVDNVNGTVKIESLATAPPVGEVILGSFRIDCTAISVDELFIAQLNANNNLLEDAFDYSVLYPESVFATVNQVPIPAAAWLLGSGLLGLVAIRRKKKS